MTSTYLFLQPKLSEVQQGCITQGAPLDKSTVNTLLVAIWLAKGEGSLGKEERKDKGSQRAVGL